MSAKRLKFKTDRDKKRSKSFERDSQSERYWREKKMGNDEMEKKDPGLRGNEKIEEAIAALQQEPTQEMLAHTLTVIRRRMKENGQLIIAVEPPKGDGQIQLQAIQTEDGKKWWAAFTGFEEELKGGGSVKSTFMTDIRKLFESALQVEEIEGIIINPWNRTIMLSKALIKIIFGEEQV